MISQQSTIQTAAAVELARLEQELEKSRAELQACKNWRAVLEKIQSPDFRELFNRHAPKQLIDFLQVLAGMEITRLEIARLMSAVAVE